MTEFIIDRPLATLGQVIVLRGYRQVDRQPLIFKRPGTPGNDRVEYGLAREFDFSSGIEGLLTPVERRYEDGVPLFVYQDPGGILLSELLATLCPLPAMVMNRLCQMAEILRQVHEKAMVCMAVDPGAFLVGEGGATFIGFHQGLFFPGQKTARGREYLSACVSPERTGDTDLVVDGRSDLYALGGIMYHLLTGAPAFPDLDGPELAHRILAHTPPPPLMRVPGLPEMLSQIAMKLLSKDPSLRYQSSHGLLHDLTHCMTQYRKRGKIPLFGLGTRDRPISFSVPECLVGRGKELAALRRAWKSKSPVSSVAVGIFGAQGMGKSALVTGFIKTLGNLCGTWLTIKCRPHWQKQPLAMVRSLIDAWIMQMLGQPEPAVSHIVQVMTEKLGAQISQLEEVLPNLRFLFGHGAKTYERPGRREDPGQVQTALLGVMELIAHLQGKISVFIDDCHWADPLSVALVARSMTIKRSGGTFWIIALDDGFPKAETIWAELDDAAGRARIPTQILTLAPLSADASEALVAAWLSRRKAAVAPLAALCRNACKASILDLKGLLLNLYDRGMIFFDPDQGGGHGMETVSERFWQDRNLSAGRRSGSNGSTGSEFVACNLRRVSERFSRTHCWPRFSPGMTSGRRPASNRRQGGD